MVLEHNFLKFCMSIAPSVCKPLPIPFSPWISIFDFENLTFPFLNHKAVYIWVSEMAAVDICQYTDASVFP